MDKIFEGQWWVEFWIKFFCKIFKRCFDYKDITNVSRPFWSVVILSSFFLNKYNWFLRNFKVGNPFDSKQSLLYKVHIFWNYAKNPKPPFDFNNFSHSFSSISFMDLVKIMINQILREYFVYFSTFSIIPITSASYFREIHVALLRISHWAANMWRQGQGWYFQLAFIECCGVYCYSCFPHCLIKQSDQRRLRQGTRRNLLYLHIYLSSLPPFIQPGDSASESLNSSTVKTAPATYKCSLNQMKLVMCNSIGGDLNFNLKTTPRHWASLSSNGGINTTKWIVWCP